MIVFLAAVFAVGILFSKSEADGHIEEKVLRFHVIANSDSEQDQALKLKVKDTLVEAMKPMLEDAGSFPIQKPS